jgi:uncharacterized protein YcbK (DUF882 family)
MSSLDERKLSFYHTHTQKTLEITYAVGGVYVESALEEVNNFLADFRTGDVKGMDPELLDIMYEVRASLGGKGTFEIISAYRSPKTNQMLRDAGKGVAKKSQHLLGKAIDIRLRNVASSEIKFRAHRYGQSPALVDGTKPVQAPDRHSFFPVIPQLDRGMTY